MEWTAWVNEWERSRENYPERFICALARSRGMWIKNCGRNSEEWTLVMMASLVQVDGIADQMPLYRCGLGASIPARAFPSTMLLIIHSRLIPDPLLIENGVLPPASAFLHLP